MERILVLAPHTDDGELGCGGAIARFLAEGKDVYYVAFSVAEKSVPDGMPKDILAREVLSATSELGIGRDNVMINRYEVRCMNFHRQEILEDMIRYKNEISPDLIFMPSLNDVHQDHHTIAEEGLRAFKNTTILGYELPWNNISFETRGFIKLKEDDIEKKISALSQYKSQKERIYFSRDFLIGWAGTRGVQIGTRYAESYEIIRWII
jgi:LmbE family N-acetylglucosaminyl deacetylase